MCINADINFAAAAVIGAVGVATLRHVNHPRAVLFACVPLFFALHQFTEAFVWLGLNGEIGPEAFSHAVFLFTLYALGVLPFLMPLAVLLLEPVGTARHKIVLALTLAGFALFVWVSYGVLAVPTGARVEGHSIAYDNPIAHQTWVAAAYVVVTCGALIASTHRVVRWFGVFNLIGVVAVLVAKGYAFTSVWCLYAAIISVMLYRQFSRQRIDVDRPNAAHPGVAIAV